MTCHLATQWLGGTDIIKKPKIPTTIFNGAYLGSFGPDFSKYHIYFSKPLAYFVHYANTHSCYIDTFANAWQEAPLCIPSPSPTHRTSFCVLLLRTETTYYWKGEWDADTSFVIVLDTGSLKARARSILISAIFGGGVWLSCFTRRQSIERRN